MFRSHTCGELRLQHAGSSVTLAGWVQTVRKFGAITFVDLRDRYGITQLVFNEGFNQQLDENPLGREFVLQAKGNIIERSNKNLTIPTGEVEIEISEFTILNKSAVPPFTIQDDTDGGDDIRMKYRYLDLRRNAVKKNLELRYAVNRSARNFLHENAFMDIETPFLIKSTPEGARDFVVPSRMNQGQYYALPQSPQTFKQLLMVSGYDRYYQIVKCFRDEDLRADRQPEFTQIDCEMAFVNQEDILHTFEGLVKHLFQSVKGVDLGHVPHLTYADAMKFYGNDKPDLRFDMKFVDLTALAKGAGFAVIDQAEIALGICAKGAGEYTRKQLDELTEWVKRPQIGAKGLIYVRYQQDGVLKSSVDKFYSQEQLKSWADACDAAPGDLLLVLSGDEKSTRKQLSELRLKMGEELGLRDRTVFVPLWVVDFPLLEWDEESQRFYAMHHPFTSHKREDIPLLESDPGAVRANAYDLVINGVEEGGGSIRIHDRATQQLMFTHLGFTEEEAQKQFGFLLEAFEYGAPPHGGIAFGFDRLCAIFGGSDSIRDYIAFPKNNSGRDVMIDSPSTLADAQLEELSIRVALKK